MKRGVGMTRAEFNDICNALRCGDTYAEIIRNHDVSAETIARVKRCVKRIDTNNTEALMALYNRNMVTLPMYTYASEIIYARLDALTKPDEPTEPEKQREGIPDWFKFGVRALPEISMICKAVALAIDTALDAWTEEGKL